MNTTTCAPPAGVTVHKGSSHPTTSRRWIHEGVGRIGRRERESIAIGSVTAIAAILARDAELASKDTREADLAQQEHRYDSFDALVAEIERLRETMRPFAFGDDDLSARVLKANIPTDLVRAARQALGDSE